MSPKSTFYDDPRKARVFQLVCKYANKGELERLINETKHYFAIWPKACQISWIQT